MGGDGKVFTLAEVSEHSSSQDCWIVIDGKVPPFSSLSQLSLFDPDLLRSGSIPLSKTVIVDLLDLMALNH